MFSSQPNVIVLRDYVTPGIMSSHPMMLRGCRETINAPATVNVTSTNNQEMPLASPFGPTSPAAATCRATGPTR